MAYYVSDLRDSVSGILSGLNLDNVTNLYGAFERASRILVQKANIPETVGRESVTIYDKVFNYNAPTNIFGGALIDFRTQGDNRDPNDFVYKKPVELFDRTKHLLPNGTMVTFEHNQGTGIMRVSSTNAKQGVVLDPMTDASDWTAGGNAGTLVDDDNIYYHGSSSIRFNVSASGSTANIYRTLSGTSDLTDYEGVGVAFLAVYIPTQVSNITSITLQIGSDSSNYWEVTNTAGFIKAFTASEWNIVDFDLSGSTETGTVDVDAVDYVNVIINYDGTALTNVRMGELWISLPKPMEVIYTSAAMFQTSGGSPATTITNDSDTILIGDAGYSLLEYEASKCVLEQSGGTLSNPLLQTITANLYGNGKDLGLYAHYNAQNPNEEIKIVGSWY